MKCARILFGVLLGGLSVGISPLYAQKDLLLDPAVKPVVVVNPRVDWAYMVPVGWTGKVQKDKSFYAWMNANSFAPKNLQEEENKSLRVEWKNLLWGVDVFMPYFKAREVEEFVKSKTHVEVFNMKGRAEFNYKRKQVEYIFKRKF